MWQSIEESCDVVRCAYSDGVVGKVIEGKSAAVPKVKAPWRCWLGPTRERVVCARQSKGNKKITRFKNIQFEKSIFRT